MGEAERQVGAPAVDTSADPEGAHAASGPANGQQRTPEEIERDIERTREELGDTVAALAEKTDVKARVHDKVEETRAKVTGKVEETKAKVTEKADSASPSNVDPAQVAQTARETATKPPTLIIAAFAAGLVLGAVIAKRRAS